MDTEFLNTDTETDTVAEPEAAPDSEPETTLPRSNQENTGETASTPEAAMSDDAGSVRNDGAPPPAEFEVHMTYKFIYDMMLYQMYSTLAGFLINIVGLTIIIMGARQLFRPDISAASGILYLILGIAVLAYTPISLRNKARKDMKQEKYRHPIRYIFDNSGIDEIMYDGFNHYGWDQVTKAVSTPKTISFYMGGGNDVLIFPKESFNDAEFASAMYYLTHNVVMGKIYIH